MIVIIFKLFIIPNIHNELAEVWFYKFECKALFETMIICLDFACLVVYDMKSITLMTFPYRIYLIIMANLMKLKTLKK